jgi:hypothetical protein
MLSQKQLHRLNNLLSLVVVAAALYILLTPFLPDVQYGISKTVRAASPSVATVEEIVPIDNRLIISEIGVNAPILEGESAGILDQGIWRRPNTSTPDKGGNTVLVGQQLFIFFPK